MTQTQTLTLAQIEALAYDALIAAGTTPQNARPLAQATAATEADGVSSHGLAYIPIYCSHVQCGKVDGAAVPRLSQTRPGALCVDAATGFAHSAIDLGFEALIPLARAQGIAFLAIRNSYNCGVLGYHTTRLAEAGLLGLGFTNAPASIAPSGGQKPIVGTNPFSLAVPAEAGQGPSLLIDQSASAIAKSEVMKYAREGREIPLGWALDASGAPTTDAEAGLKGSMAPSGGYKGVGVALLTEVMAAVLTGAHLGQEASPFSGTAGGPPKTGQFFIAIDPEASAEGSWHGGMARLIAGFRAQEGAHLPGDGRGAKRLRAQSEGVAVQSATIEAIRAIIAG